LFRPMSELNAGVSRLPRGWRLCWRGDFYKALGRSESGRRDVRRPGRSNGPRQPNKGSGRRICARVSRCGRKAQENGT
jgi:hypothetical protein